MKVRFHCHPFISQMCKLRPRAGMTFPEGHPRRSGPGVRTQLFELFSHSQKLRHSQMPITRAPPPPQQEVRRGYYHHFSGRDSGGTPPTVISSHPRSPPSSALGFCTHPTGQGKGCSAGVLWGAPSSPRSRDPSRRN